jgi:PPK2 family polyphosphate:nucleotide phosphotransferase
MIESLRYTCRMGKKPKSLRDALAFADADRKLADIDPSARPFAPAKKRAFARKLEKDAARIASLQDRLWAEAAVGGSRSVLLVLQGIDTAGKGGTTEHVITACGPIGVQYTGFKQPTPEEMRHDFLWRIRKRVPPPGVLGIFDRSHYEDVLVPRVHQLIPLAECDARYAKINAFERQLAARGTTLVKVFLHISYDTQRERLLARLDNPDKRWKFNEADLDERALWPRYQEAFQAMLERCDTSQAPWYVVPSDSKKYRNWAVGRLLRETFEELDPRYPDAVLDVAALRKRLAPPN